MSTPILPLIEEVSNKSFEKVDKKLERRHDNQHIPIAVWLHKGLSITDKALLVDIYAFSLEKGYCWASNARLGKGLGLSASRMSRAVKSLEDNGIVLIEQIMDGKQYLERRIRMSPEFDFRGKPEWYEEDESDPTAPKFSGVNIPLYIWENRTLSIGQRMMLGQIALLEGKVRGCWAGNQHFADLFGLSLRQVSRIISSLSDIGYITVQQIRVNKKCVERRIFTVKETVDKSTSGQICNTPPPCKSDVNPLQERREPLANPSRTPCKSVVEKALEKEKKKESSKDTGRAALAGLRQKASSFSDSENQKQEPEVGQAKELVEQSEAMTPRAVKDLYDKILGKKLMPAGALTAKRKQQILSLTNLKSLKDQNQGAAAPAFWVTLFTYVRDNAWLTGSNNSNWAASFDWLINEENLIKVLGGTYNKRSKDFYASETPKRHEAPYSPDGIDYSRTGMMSAGKIAKGVYVKEITQEEMAERIQAQLNEY